MLKSEKEVREMAKIQMETLLEVDGESPKRGQDTSLEGRPAALEWQRIDERGSESLRRGVAWSLGPRLRYGDVVWAVAGACYVPVLITRRRHRSRGGVGRWVDPGEAYTDHAVRTSAVASWSRRDGWTDRSGWSCWGRPGDKVLRVAPLPKSIYVTLSTPHG